MCPAPASSPRHQNQNHPAPDRRHHQRSARQRRPASQRRRHPHPPGDAAARANREGIRQRYLSLRTMQGRLQAEQGGQTRITWHPDLITASQDPLISQQMRNQQHLLDAPQRTQLRPPGHPGIHPGPRRTRPVLHPHQAKPAQPGTAHSRRAAKHPSPRTAGLRTPQPPA